MHIPEGQSTPWVYGVIRSRSEQSAELKPSAQIKPEEAQVQNLKPHEQASRAFESENSPSITGRGSLSLDKFEMVITRITNAVKSFFNELIGKKPKQEPAQEPKQEGLGRAERRSLGADLEKLKDEKMALETRAGSNLLFLKKMDAIRQQNINALMSTSIDPDEFVQKQAAENEKYNQLPEHAKQKEIQASLDKVIAEIAEFKDKLK